jgi:hypothetical protein
MAVPTNTFQTYQAVGNAEDFENAIYMISPTETPILMMAERLKASNRTHQWLTDELAAASATNATIEGDDASADAAIPAVNLKNYCQLMDKVAFVSDVQETVDKYGRSSEMKYQMAKRSKELKNDLEAALCQNNAGTAGAAASAALMASLESWLAFKGGQAGSIKTANGTSVGTGTSQTTPGFTTANGVPVTAPTDSTVAGSVTETTLKTCIADTWDAGGNPTNIVCGALVKQKISGAFSGIATRFREVNSGQRAQIIGGADLYVSDFGEHKIMASHFVRSRTLFGIDPRYIGVAYLQPFSQMELARTGHAEKRMIRVNATLVLQNPFAHFKIADINGAL